MDQSIKEKWRSATGYDRFIAIATAGYLLIISAFMIWHQQFFSPDRFFVFALVGAAAAGKIGTFLWDWTPPILLILGYEYLRGIVPQLITKVHIRAMIYFDRFLFGNVPTIALQHAFFNINRLHWYDYTAVTLYLLHFVVPMLAALLFWVLDRTLFRMYMAAMVALSYLAFATYYFFPAMPPWLAAQQGFLPPVAHIMDLVFAHFAHPISLPTVYQYVGANLVAAVPSLHAAYPLMTALFFYRKFPKYGAIAFAYPVAMWFAVMYLGEHYAFDIIVATIYVLGIYALITNWRNVRTRIKNFILKIFHRRQRASQVAN